MKKTKASVSKTAADEDEAEPKKIRSSRSSRHRGRRSHSSSRSESPPPHKVPKNHSKRIADKKSKRSKASSSSRRRHRHRSLSPSRSLSSSSSSPSSIARHSGYTCSSSSTSETSVSPPPRSQSRDVRKKRERGRDRERDRKRRRKARRSASSSSTSATGGSSRSRSRSKSRHRKRRRNVAGTRDKIEIDNDNRHASRSEKNMAEDNDRDEEALAPIAKKRDDDIDRYKKNVESESPPPKSASETQETAPASGGKNSDAEDLELILRQKALENFRKFRAAAVMADKTDTNGATENETFIDGPQNAGTEIAEVRSSAVTHFQTQGSHLVMKNSAGSHRSEDCGNGTSHPWKQEGSAGVSRGASATGILEAGYTGGPTQQKGRTVEATHSNCQFRSPQDDRSSHRVMPRLVSTPGSFASVNQRLGRSAGPGHVNGTPRVRSVVSIPTREGLDGSTYTTPPRPSENSAPVESSSDVGCPLIGINKAETTYGDNTKTREASASNGSIIPSAEGNSQATEDKDGSQFQKKTFSRMHDGETVEVSYKVYIPKKTPALARRKLRR